MVNSAVADAPNKQTASCAPAQVHVLCEPNAPVACAASAGDTENVSSMARATTLWLLFLLGWLLPPCWWLGTALGLHVGGGDCLITRRSSSKSGSQAAAWRACVAMSIVSVLAVILVPAILMGRPSAKQAGRVGC